MRRLRHCRLPDGVDAVPMGSGREALEILYRRQLHLRDAAVARRAADVPHRSAAGDTDDPCADGVAGKGVREGLELTRFAT